MKARTIWVSLFLLFVAAFCSKSLVGQHKLSTALAFIESEYKPQLVLIEREMQEKTFQIGHLLPSGWIGPLSRSMKNRRNIPEEAKRQTLT